MRSRLFTLFAFAVLLFAAGCERQDNSVFTVEGDEPAYRRGKDLIKQGRNQEALSEFQKVIEKRGLSNAPESHLEVGLLYQYHLKDPIAAIFHYRKYRELKPNSPQSDLVRQRIDSATRDFARLLPGQPLENQLDRLDMSDLAQRLQRENDKLKADLAAARAGKPAPASEAATTPAADAETPPEATPAPARPVAVANNETSPVTRAALDPEPTPAQVTPVAPARPPVTTQPVRPAPSVATTPARPSPTSTRSTTPSTNAARPAATGAYRRHTVKAQESLYSIARKYFGTGSNANVDAIFNANRDQMKTKADLRVGMELKIPQ
jgi:tetratricopeptide (TPR) repeat protein